MTEPGIDMNAVEELVDEMKGSDTFNFRDALKQVSYPTGHADIYLDGAKAGELQQLTEEIAEKQATVKHLRAGSEGNGGIADDPDVEVAVAEIEELEARQVALIQTIRASRQRYHLRGVAPAVWRAIDKNARATFPATKGLSPEEELEISMARNEFVNHTIVAHCITKVENAKGQVDTSAWKTEDVQNLHDTVLESEWFKLKSEMEKLTFAANLFGQAATQDADFLPQP